MNSPGRDTRAGRPGTSARRSEPSELGCRRRERRRTGRIVRSIADRRPGARHHLLPSGVSGPLPATGGVVHCCHVLLYLPRRICTILLFTRLLTPNTYVVRRFCRCVTLGVTRDVRYRSHNVHINYNADHLW